MYPRRFSRDTSGQRARQLGMTIWVRSASDRHVRCIILSGNFGDA